MINENNLFQVKKSLNYKKSPSRQRIRNNFFYKRGTKKYFLYLQWRYNEFYCLILHCVIYPIDIPDNFSQKDLIKQDKNLYKIKNFLKYISKKNNKKICFSLNSEKIVL